jgi:hypothetical protein
VGETSRFQYIIRDGVLKLSGQIRYQDRDLRLALMRLFMVPQHQVCLDLTEIPSLCSPEMQFVTKMAQLGRDHGKFFRVRLSKSLRSMFKDLELEGLVEIEEVQNRKSSAPKTRTSRPPAART